MSLPAITSPADPGLGVARSVTVVVNNDAQPQPSQDVQVQLPTTTASPSGSQLREIDSVPYTYTKSLTSQSNLRCRGRGARRDDRSTSREVTGCPSSHGHSGCLTSSFEPRDLEDEGERPSDNEEPGQVGQVPLADHNIPQTHSEDVNAQRTESQTTDSCATNASETETDAPKVSDDPSPSSALEVHDTSLNWIETFINSFSPYREMRDQSNLDAVRRRLVAEWFTVGGYLLATAALNAAVFGYAWGGGTLFEIEDIALRSVTLGSLVAGVGLIIDAWFLMRYNRDVERFRTRATHIDETGRHNYIYFCLSCRLPLLCLIISTAALLLFLLVVAWKAWPLAVILVSTVAGILLSLRHIVFITVYVVRGLSGVSAILNAMFLRLNWESRLTSSSNNTNMSAHVV